MKCPRCEWELRGVERRRKGKPCYRLAVCDACGWKSAPYEQLIERSPEYRLAKLKAAKAEPGWYGPDGRKWQVAIGLRTGEAYLVRGPDESEDIEHARLCGFVEVRYE